MTWEEKFEILKEYLKEHNGEYPKREEIYKGINLGFWIDRQRTTYNNGEKQEDGSIVYEAHILTKEQMDKLNSIGFMWIANLARFKNKTITTKGQLEGARRYLQSIIEELEKEGVQKEDLDKKLLMRL